MEADCGSSNTEYASRVENQPKDNYNTTSNYSTNSKFCEFTHEQYKQDGQYSNGTQTVSELSKGASTPASYLTSTYPQHQSTYYATAPVDSQDNAVYPTELSVEDEQNPPAQYEAYEARDPARQSSSSIARPYTPPNGQRSNYHRRENRMHTINSDGYHPTVTMAPPSPQAQRYIEDQTPEERLRLGLTRFEDQQQRIDYYTQQVNYYTHPNSTDGQRTS